MSDRASQLADFVATALREMGRSAQAPWQAITGDASFRHFHRVPTDQGALIAVDAPPATENNSQYLRIAARWRAAGLPVPQIFAHDLTAGFFLVSDLGDLLFAQAIGDGSAAAAPDNSNTSDNSHTSDNSDALYGRAIQLLQRIQTLPEDGTCPAYEPARLRMELGIFREWFLGAALQYTLSPTEDSLLQATESQLLANIAAQPRCCVHRDWHSRNLLVQADGSLGIIDFQDALIGPYVYDLVSLLRDCYLRWPDNRIAAWQRLYLQDANERIRAHTDRNNNFQTDFDLTGMQRHLKAIGIFARLWRRDGRTGYLGDIPRVLGYLRDVAAEQQSLTDFADWIATRIEPAWQACEHP